MVADPRGSSARRGAGPGRFQRWSATPGTAMPRAVRFMEFGIASGLISDQRREPRADRPGPSRLAASTTSLPHADRQLDYSLPLRRTPRRVEHACVSGPIRPCGVGRGTRLRAPYMAERRSADGRDHRDGGDDGGDDGRKQDRDDDVNLESDASCGAGEAAPALHDRDDDVNLDRDGDRRRHRDPLTRTRRSDLDRPSCGLRRSTDGTAVGIDRRRRGATRFACIDRPRRGGLRSPARSPARSRARTPARSRRRNQPAGPSPGPPPGPPARSPTSEPTGPLLSPPASPPVSPPAGQPTSQPTGQPSSQPPGQPTGQRASQPRHQRRRQRRRHRRRHRRSTPAHRAGDDAWRRVGRSTRGRSGDRCAARRARVGR